MYPYNNKPKIEKYFNFVWRCLIAVGLFFVFKEIKYIADIITGYVRMLLQTGTF
tara:strand:- start:6073 stop:6234 length:162 start_codon:yes stop_codon:yes gene_type:complete